MGGEEGSNFDLKQEPPATRVRAPFTVLRTKYSTMARLQMPLFITSFIESAAVGSVRLERFVASPLFFFLLQLIRLPNRS